MKSIIYLALAILFAITSSLPVHTLPVQALPQEPGSTFSCTDVTEIPQSECEALMALYNSTNGDDWRYNDGWLEWDTPGSWYGVTVESGHVTQLGMVYNNLSGYIPSELGDLSNLNTLDLSENQLSGYIPSELGNLTSLTHMDLWLNQLNGGIPDELGDLSNLVYLNLAENRLRGLIPPELSNLSSLTEIWLNNNQLSGSIPPELGNLSNLYELSLSHNQLSGLIPLELGNLSNLTSLYLSDNFLSGSIPPVLGNLSNMMFLDLSNNQLSGSIPSELGNLIELKILYLGDNLLQGDVPETFINLVNLCPYQCGEEAPNGLKLNYNSLNVPPGYPDPSNTFHVFLQSKDPYWHLRQISDFVDCSSVVEIPQIECQALVALYNSTNGAGWAENTNWLVTNTPGNWYGIGTYGPWLTTLDLHDNQLSGSLPPELGNLSWLWNLNLSGNQLSGTIPPQLGDLSYLNTLSLERNQLSGSIPLELGNLSSLRVLNLSNNQLGGSIPSILGTMGTLNELNLSHNQLNGSIPPGFGNQIPLQVLYLDHNQISGSIPPDLGNPDALQVLDLSSNQISESIPTELGDLIFLMALRLNHNQITGVIPSSFINLTYLGYHGIFWDGGDGLDLASNFLQVPSGYPDPLNPLHLFLSQVDPDWHLYQGFEQVIGVGGGELISPDGWTDLLIPEGALITDTTFTFMPLPAPSHSSGWMAFANNSFEITAEDANDNPVIDFNLPVTVTLTYTNMDVVGIEDSLGLYYWDEVSSSWMDTVMTCPGGEYRRDPGANLLTLPLCHLTEFGVFGMPLRLFLPVIQNKW